MAGGKYSRTNSKQRRRTTTALILLLSLVRAGTGQLASAPVIAPTAPALTATAQSTSKTPSAVALTITTPSSVIYGQAIDGLAQVNASDGSTVTGTVTFYDGTTSFCTLALADGASCPPGTETNFGAETHVFTVGYSGDATHAAATSNAVTVTVTRDTTTTALASSINPIAAGRSVIYTAMVTGAHGPVTGTVTFLDGTASMGSATLDSNGAATLSSIMLAPGNHTITAMYTGNTNSASSTSAALNQVVQAGLTATTTTLTTSANPATFGQSITLTSAVTAVGAKAPTGTVTFVEGRTLLGSAPLDAMGVATWGTSTLAVGNHSIIARYAGDTNSAPSISSAITQVVNNSTPPNIFTIGVDQITVEAGETALVPIKVAAGSSFTKAITLNCSGLPEEASCSSATGASATAESSTLTLKISTSAPRDCGSPTPYGSPQQKSSLPVTGTVLAGLILVLIPKRRRPLRHLLVALLSIAAITGVSGCGTGNCTDLGTRPGTYTVTITGQSGGATVSQKVKLIVKP